MTRSKTTSTGAVIGALTIILAAGCSGGGADLPASEVPDGGGGGTGTVPVRGTVEACKVTLTRDPSSASTGKTIGVTARVDARIIDGGTTREIVNETSTTAFAWKPSTSLEEVSNPALGTKKLFTSKLPGEHTLVVTSTLSPTCTSSIDLTFTGLNLTDPYPVGTFEVTGFTTVVRLTSSRRGCDPGPGMTLTIERTSPGMYRSRISGTSTCSGDQFVCTDRVADLAADGRTTTPISGGCSLTTTSGTISGSVPANAAYDVDFAPASIGTRTRYVVGMNVENANAYHSRVELSFVLP